MRILSADFIQHWPDKIINIHPSLLPDYKGVAPQARAIADGKTESGCSVHFVVPEVDAGPVILQRTVPILPGDTAEELSARLLPVEHSAYPEAIRKIALERLESI
jgi:phosphoribosylglycinamide formyltransferase-1